ncbi:MAG: hypothetical protein ACL7AY_15930 [Candidatus Arsenophonus phytopathogenicus]
MTRTAVAAADLRLSPVNDDPSDILGLQEFSQVLEEISREIGVNKIAHVLLNKVHPPRINFKDIDNYLKQFDNLVRLDPVIPLDKSVPEKFGAGLGVVEHIKSRNGRAGNAMRSLFLDLRSVIKNVH